MCENFISPGNGTISLVSGLSWHHIFGPPSYMVLALLPHFKLGITVAFIS